MPNKNVLKINILYLMLMRLYKTNNANKNNINSEIKRQG